MMIKALAEVELCQSLEHLPEALQRRFVEAIQRLDLLDTLTVHALPAAVFRSTTTGGFASTGLAALKFNQCLLDRTARHELDHGESNSDHAQQRGNHQQQALGNIGPEVHEVGSRMVSAVKLVFLWSCYG